MVRSTTQGRRARGEIERLPSGSLRVRVYAGVDPDTGRRRYLQQTVAAGPAAQREAEAVRARLLDEAHERRDPPAATNATGAINAARRRRRERGVATIATIARVAGVSAPTVSKVLNGRSDVAAETRLRV